MTVTHQVAFDATCSHLFTEWYDEFTCCNDTVTASDLAVGPLSRLTAKGVNRSLISALNSALTCVFLSSQRVGG